MRLSPALLVCLLLLAGAGANAAAIGTFAGADPCPRVACTGGQGGRCRCVPPAEPSITLAAGTPNKAKAACNYGRGFKRRKFGTYC